MKCIYCKTNITKNNFSEEHVFPEAFGCPDSWILKCVCRKCNNEMGGSIDRFLASDSIEGLWRLQNIGSKSKKSIRQVRLKLSIPEEEKYSAFKGLKIYIDFSKKDCLYLPMQVSYIYREERKVILVEDIDENIAGEINENLNSLGVFANDASEIDKLVEILNSKNIYPDINQSMGLQESAIESDGKLEIVVSSVMDDFIFRAIAKIAFNYLAKVHTDDYALESRFDIVRNYIRSGKIPKDKIVRLVEGHILSDETSTQYYFQGHCFTIKLEGKKIVGQVSLTNTFNFYYEVELGEIGEIWIDLTNGHGYSFENDCIVDLHSSSPTFLKEKGFVVRRGFM